MVRKLAGGLLCWALVLAFAGGLLLGAFSCPAAWAAGELQVENMLPQGRVERLSQVAVRFSQPMRPLGEMEQATESSPLTVTPRPTGSFRWLDAQTLAYILDQPLSGPMRLEVKVAAGVKALNGNALAHDYLGRVETPPLSVLETSPS